MIIKNIFYSLRSFITPHGRMIRRFAKEYGLKLPDAFNLVSLTGSIQGAKNAIKEELEKRREMRGYSSYNPEPPQNTYTSGSRLSS